MDTISLLIQRSGGTTALAKRLKVSLQIVSNWKRRGSVPASSVIPACKASGWEITPHQLRPDLYPHPDDGLPEELRKGERAA